MGRYTRLLLDFKLSLLVSAESPVASGAVTLPFERRFTISHGAAAWRRIRCGPGPVVAQAAQPGPFKDSVKSMPGPPHRHEALVQLQLKLISIELVEA